MYTFSNLLVLVVMILFYMITYIDLFFTHRVYSLLRLFKSFTYMLAIRAMENIIIERVRKSDATKIKAEVIENVKVSNIETLELDVLKLSNLINTLARLYFLLLVFLGFILSINLKGFMI